MTDATYMMKLTERQRTEAKLARIAALAAERNEAAEQLGGTFFRRLATKRQNGEKL